MGVIYTQNPDCRIKNVNYQRSVEAAMTTAMEITASNTSDAKCTGIKRRKRFVFADSKRNFVLPLQQR